MRGLSVSRTRVGGAGGGQSASLLSRDPRSPLRTTSSQVPQTANFQALPHSVYSPALMGGVRVTKHAAKRWRERVCQCTHAQARDAILAHAPAIIAAAAFGSRTVKLASRHRLKLEGTTVLTVLPEGRF